MSSCKEAIEGLPLNILPINSSCLGMPTSDRSGVFQRTLDPDLADAPSGAAAGLRNRTADLASALPWLCWRFDLSRGSSFGLARLRRLRFPPTAPHGVGERGATAAQLLQVGVARVADLRQLTRNLLASSEQRGCFLFRRSHE